ncbi:hypothetical protein AC579_6546 [Pseudocercospora musae]|uniref:Uncharacterized protein n=1 Tax=Pseudocercospora musae TaxID=113226 RepID=A0A139ILT7_9PEZI|nr:hypothetical protein AC579_6546 [Pseudocercospora musae]
MNMHRFHQWELTCMHEHEFVWPSPLQYDSSKAVTTKPSWADHSVFGFESLSEATYAPSTAVFG